MSFSWYVARRYLLARGRMAFITVIALISTLGITVGVMALVITLALMTGVQNEIRDKILGANAHVVVFAGWRSPNIPEPAELQGRLAELEGTVASAPVVLEKGLLTSELNDSGSAVQVWGIDPVLQARVTRTAEDVIEGSLADLRPASAGTPASVVVGKDLARELALRVGDDVRLLVPRLKLSPFMAVPRNRALRVVGIVDSGFYEYDSTRAYLHLETARQLYGYGDAVTAVAIRTMSLDDLARYTDAVREHLGTSHIVTNLEEMNRTFFSAMRLEKIVMFLTFGLIVLVAALNIVSTLVLIVMDKTRDIGAMVSMGASPALIMGIFVSMGGAIAVVGTVLGSAGGFLTSRLLDAYQVIRLPEDVYYITHVPFHPQVQDFLWVSGLTLVVSFLATLYPAWKAATVDPISTLRYE